MVLFCATNVQICGLFPAQLSSTTYDVSAGHVVGQTEFSDSAF